MRQIERALRVHKEPSARMFESVTDKIKWLSFLFVQQRVCFDFSLVEHGQLLVTQRGVGSKRHLSGRERARDFRSSSGLHTALPEALRGAQVTHRLNTEATGRGNRAALQIFPLIGSEHQNTISVTGAIAHSNIAARRHQGLLRTCCLLHCVTGKVRLALIIALTSTH